MRVRAALFNIQSHRITGSFGQRDGGYQHLELPSGFKAGFSINEPLDIQPRGSVFLVETGERRTPRPMEETQNLLQDYSDL